LSDGCRPKGLSCWYDDEMRSLLTLAMTGQVTDNVAAAAAVFVPSSVTADYQLQLQLGSSRCQHKLPRFTYLLTYLLSLINHSQG